jgi:hypothetical protein
MERQKMMYKANRRLELDTGLSRLLHPTMQGGQFRSAQESPKIF